MNALRNRQLYVAAAALALAALLVAVLAGGGAERSAAKAGRTPVVGKVAAIGGNGKITVKPKGGTKHKLSKGDKLHLGDTIDPNKGATAKLKLSVPNGVSDDKELVFVRPGKSEEHTIRLERTDRDTTTVKISD